MNLSARVRRLAAVTFVASAVAAAFAAPAEAAPPPPSKCVLINCGVTFPIWYYPDLYLATMYQRDAAGNSISSATAGQTVVYPITVGNQGAAFSATNVEVWWMGDTAGISSQGWMFQSFTADSGFTCHQPGDDFTGEQVRCSGGTVAAGAVAHITITMSAPTVHGAHKIGVSLDPLGAIAESNETNNTPCCLTLNT